MESCVRHVRPWSARLLLPALAVVVVLVVVLITYLSLILGELVPKQLALRHPERIASLVKGIADACATAGAFLLLLFYRILGGKLFKGMQGEHGVILEVTKARRGPKAILREVA